MLGEFAQNMEDVLEAEVRLVMGAGLVELERFSDAREHLERTRDLARHIEDPTTLSHALWLLGRVAFRVGDFEAGIDWAAEGADVADSIGRFDILWRCANVQGLIEERFGDYSAALESFQRALAAAENSNDAEGLFTVHGSIGIAMMNVGEHEQALESFLLARELEVDAASESATTLANLGDVSYLLDDYDSAKEYHLEALGMRQAAGSEVELALSHHSLGAIHYTCGDLEQSLENFEQALELRQRLKLVPEQAETLAGLSVVLAALDEEARATEAVGRSLEITDQFEMGGRRLGVLESLAGMQEKLGNATQALKALREARAVEREQLSAATRRQIAQFRAQLDSKEQERRIALLTKEGALRDLAMQRQRQVRNYLVVGSSLLALIALAGWGAWAVLRRTHRALTVANETVQRHSERLEQASTRIQRLEGLLPICAECKSVRDDVGAWLPIEDYVDDHTEASFTHGLCPTCVEDLSSQAGLRFTVPPGAPLPEGSVPRRQENS